MAIYNPKSLKAEEFINHEEILDTIRYAEENKHNLTLIDEILAKARPVKSADGTQTHCAGLSHREASVLLACDIPEKVAEMYELAEEIKQAFYGNRIVMFAPLYLSNYCVNGCVYCPYHMKNKHIARIKLTQEEIRREVVALQDMGHKRLAIEAGEDPVNNPIEYILECINTIYSIKHKNGAIRRVNVNIAATTVENYRKLKDAGIGTYILFQETYHKQSYLKLHPAGPKHDYDYHTEAMDRAMDGGIDDVGLGVLFGLEMYKYEFAGLLMHAEHLEAVHGVGPHTISVPRIKRADDIDPDVFDNGLSDELFAKVIACIRIAVPYTHSAEGAGQRIPVRGGACGIRQQHADYQAGFFLGNLPGNYRPAGRHGCRRGLHLCARTQPERRKERPHRVLLLDVLHAGMRTGYDHGLPPNDMGTVLLPDRRRCVSRARTVRRNARVRQRTGQRDFGVRLHAGHLLGCPRLFPVRPAAGRLERPRLSADLRHFGRGVLLQPQSGAQGTVI